MNKNDQESDINVSSINLECHICFCFKHSKSELYDAIKKNQEEEIVKNIKSKVKDPGCFCEKANPIGKCCLNDVKAFINTVKNLKK